MFLRILNSQKTVNSAKKPRLSPKKFYSDFPKYSPAPGRKQSKNAENVRKSADFNRKQHFLVVAGERFEPTTSGL